MTCPTCHGFNGISSNAQYANTMVCATCITRNHPKNVEGFENTTDWRCWPWWKSFMDVQNITINGKECYRTESRFGGEHFSSFKC